MVSLRRVGALLAKDLHDALRSHTILFSVLVPVVLALCFSWIMEHRDLDRPTLAVSAPGTSELCGAVDALGMFRVQRVAQADEVRGLVRSGRAVVGLVLPAGFDRSLTQGQRPSLLVVAGPLAPERTALLVAKLTEMVRSQAGQEAPVELRLERLGEDSRPWRAVLPTWVLFAVLGGLMIVSSSLVEEKETRTLPALLVTPLGKGELLAGKWILGVVLTVLGAGSILVLNHAADHPLATAACLLAGAACFSALGLLVGVLAPSQGSANSVISVLLVVFFLPPVLADSSRLLDAVARWLPSYYLMDGMNRALLLGAGLGALKLHLAVLLAGAALFATGAVLTLGRLED